MLCRQRRDTSLGWCFWDFGGEVKETNFKTHYQISKLRLVVLCEVRLECRHVANS